MPRLGKLYLHFVVVLGAVVGPRASIGTDHVSAVAQSAEVEGVGLRDHDVLVAHADGYPVRIAFADFEVEDFVITALF